MQVRAVFPLLGSISPFCRKQPHRIPSLYAQAPRHSPTGAFPSQALVDVFPAQAPGPPPAESSPGSARKTTLYSISCPGLSTCRDLRGAGGDLGGPNRCPAPQRQVCSELFRMAKF